MNNEMFYLDVFIVARFRTPLLIPSNMVDIDKEGKKVTSEAIIRDFLLMYYLMLSPCACVWCVYHAGGDAIGLRLTQTIVTKSKQWK